MRQVITRDKLISAPSLILLSNSPKNIIFLRTIRLDWNYKNITTSFVSSSLAIANERLYASGSNLIANYDVNQRTRQHRPRDEAALQRNERLQRQNLS